MDKKPKEALRRYKKRPESSSDSSSSSDSDSSSSDSYSSSSSKKKGHRKKKIRNRASSSSSNDDRARKRDKHGCHKNLEAKRNHLKRKLKEAKSKKRATSPSQRRRSVSPGHKLKKASAAGAEKKHHRTSSKERLLRERERERDKVRIRDRERGRSRSPKAGKSGRPHPDLKRKSPQGRHQLSPREKIIIQARRDRSPSDRKRELKVRHDSRERERRDRDASRNKEREEALARCQERQRERERVARDKLRREKEKDYERDRLLPRPAEREMAMAQARSGFDSRERSLEQDPRGRHAHAVRPVRDPALEREREYEHHRDERREHDREYLLARRREMESPGAHYTERLRAERELYPDERAAAYARYEGALDDPRARERSWERSERELRREHEHGKLYADRAGGRDWKVGEEEWNAELGPWDEKAWARSKKLSEAEWELADKYAMGKNWDEAMRGKHESSAAGGSSRRWPQEWRGSHSSGGDSLHRHTGSQQGSYRHPLEYSHERSGYRHHHGQSGQQQHSVGYQPRHFPSKRQMTYTNPNLVRKPTTVTSGTGGQSDPATASTSESTDAAPIAEENPESEQTPTGESDNKSEAVEQPDEGEITSPVEKTPVESAGAADTSATSGNDAEDVIPDDLSEISDGADDILEKEEEVKNPESTAEPEEEMWDANEKPEDADAPKDGETTSADAPKEVDELLDFEEISDNELEEESRIKGVGDALGVDWASLVAEAKMPETKNQNACTAKEKWQPHRILLDVGVSFKYAGEDLARSLLADAKSKFDEEMGNQTAEQKIKIEVKDEDVEMPEPTPPAVKDEIHPLACVQVARRAAAEERKNLIFNACGANSRALSARRDLRLRRKLCGLPVQETEAPRPIADNIKAMALRLFQKAIEA